LLRFRLSHHRAAPRRRNALVSLAPLLMSVATLTTATAAQAGTYEIWQCHDGEGRSVGVDGYFVGTLGQNVVIDRCSELNGQFEITPLNGTISPQPGPTFQTNGFTFNLPAADYPNLKMTAVSAQLSIAAKEAGAEANGGFTTSPGPGYWTSESFPASSWPGFKDKTYSGFTPAGMRRVSFELGCYKGCWFPTGPTIALRRAKITIEDFKVPATATLTVVGVLDGSIQRGTRILRFDAADGDSGIRVVELRGPGGVIASTVAGESCVFSRPVPCPPSMSQRDLAVDTTKLSDGAQSLELWVTDAGGNTSKVAVPAFTVDNVADASPPIASPGPNPTTVLAPAPKVTFGLSNKRPRTGVRVVLSGAISPAPVPKGRVIIEVKDRKVWRTAALVNTRKDGKFTWSHKFRKRAKFTLRARLLTSVETKQKSAISPERSLKVR
ncbi:MAG: hypothetical protein Q7T73_11220, partial [Beijerinckiaceae bacterium]|nr:hypothetical protein [Beijerinckiaceae bacterium]